jgi:hypothetical protein
MMAFRKSYASNLFGWQNCTAFLSTAAFLSTTGTSTAEASTAGTAEAAEGPGVTVIGK